MYLQYEENLLELLEKQNVFPPRHQIICTRKDKAASVTITLTVVLKNSVNDKEQEVAEFCIEEAIEGIMYSIYGTAQM